MTAFYMFRVVFMTFGGTFRGVMDPRVHPRVTAHDDAAAADPGGAVRLVGLWGAPMLGNGFAHFLEGEAFHARR